MVGELYVEPNRRAQIIFLLMIIVAGFMLASNDSIINYLAPSRNAPVEEIRSETRLLLLLAISVNFVAFALSLAWTAYVSRLGYRALKLGSFPPPGTIVVFRTRVLTGKQAALTGYLCIMVAVFSGAFAVLMGYATWLLGYTAWFLTSAL